MAEIKELFRALNKKSAFLFMGHWLTFVIHAGIFLVLFIIMYHGFWNNTVLIKKIIEAVSLPWFVVIDEMINLFTVLYILLYLSAIVIVIDAAGRGIKLGVIASYRQALRLFDQYLWVKILFAFKVLCWSLLLVVPGLIFAAFYGFHSMALIVDDKRGREALAFSKEIVKPNMKQYLACLALMSTLLFSICAVVIINLDSCIVYFSLNGNIPMIRLMNYVEMGFATLTATYFLVCYYSLYVALKEKGVKQS